MKGDVVNMEYLFMVFGPFLLVVGIITFFKRRKFAKESSVINGVVTEIRIGPARNNKTAYYPVIRYFNLLTTLEEVYESNTAYDSSKFKTGDEVELRYLNDGVKKQICLNNWFGVWGLSFMLILFGLIFSVIDFVLFFIRT
jgi:hypothetical protein